jgi:60 kDa SS-A/Ro ribonucleoprotein
VEASAAMAMVTMRVEQEYEIVGFGTDITRLNISPRQRLDDIVKYIHGLNFGGTDCALPMIWAKKHKVPAEGFLTITDNESWAGDIHPFQALKQYREAMGRPARSVVMAMTSSGFSIADPSDAGMLDCVGFDTAVPTLVSQFFAGFQGGDVLPVSDADNA